MSNPKWWVCGRKKAYTKKEANNVAMKRGSVKNKGIGIYQCEYCDMYHLTSKAHLYPAPLEPPKEEV